jgi:ADP-ribose pyrophosphatase YjhB (NUDIX family)
LRPVTARGIRVKVFGLIRRGEQVLLSFAIDPDTGVRYGRLLGGGIEPGERAEDAVHREFVEEIGAALVNVRRLGVVENIFTWQGDLHHEVIFVCAADFADRRLYDREAFVVNEAVCDGPAEWVDLHRLLNGDITVYPSEILGFLQSQPVASHSPSNEP